MMVFAGEMMAIWSGGRDYGSNEGTFERLKTWN
jgi:hypothetical protein